MKCGLSYPYYLLDGLGSVTGIVDRDGKLQGIYDYSVFGDERRNTVRIENRYRYTSREFVEDGLYYYRARHMRSDLGRFMSMDPLGTINGPNQLFYVKNQPTKFRDPYGTTVYSVPGTAAGIPGPDPQETPTPGPANPSGPLGNGNAWGGSNAQDWECSVDYIGKYANKCLKQCCREHDFCYMVFGCNQSSWAGTYWPFADRSCWICNLGLIDCGYSIPFNPDCWPKCDAEPPGPIPGFGDGPMWN